MTELAYPVTITTTQTLIFGWPLYVVDASGGSIVLTLPDASTTYNHTGDGLYIRRVDANATNTVSIVPFGAQTINNQTTALVLQAGQGTKFVVYTSTSWYTVSTSTSLNQYLFGYSQTPTQATAAANTFQDLTFTDLGETFGWTFTAGTSTFTSPSRPQVKSWMITYHIQVSANAGGTNSVTTARLIIVGGAEIVGSAFSSFAGARGQATNPVMLSNTFIVSLPASTAIRVQWENNLGTGVVAQPTALSTATTKPSTTITIMQASS